MNDPTQIPLFRSLNGVTTPVDEVGEHTVPRGRNNAHSLAGPVSAPTPALPQHPLLNQVPPPQSPVGVAAYATSAKPEPAASTTPRRARHVPGGTRMDWHLVAMLRSQASAQLGAALGDDRDADPEVEQRVGRRIIRELLESLAAERLHDGEQPWDVDDHDALEQAVYDALFGLGRLQAYVDDDTIENIVIAGYDNVWVERTDGSLSREEPVADSDAELIDFLNFVASRGESPRSFSVANPHLNMKLPGGARLAAAAWVTAYPSVVIRRHRLKEITLDTLANDYKLMTPTQASFLRAAIKARKSVVVAGPQGAGKTTLVRALCAEIPPWEAIGTFETEFELFLHEMPETHPIVHAWESRPGSGEVTASGRPAGEFTLDEAMYYSFRYNLLRQIVGEVRGKEIWAMIKAMESGTGSVSTTHASDAEAAIRKLVTCAMEAGPHITRELATSKLAETVDIVVQVNLQTMPIGNGEWKRTRTISEIIHVTPGEQAKGYATTHIFRPNPTGGFAVADTLPDELRDLEHFGFDLGSFLAESHRQGAAR